MNEQNNSNSHWPLKSKHGLISAYLVFLHGRVLNKPFSLSNCFPLCSLTIPGSRVHLDEHTAPPGFNLLGNSPFSRKGAEMGSSQCPPPHCFHMRVSLPCVVLLFGLPCGERRELFLFQGQDIAPGAEKQHDILFCMCPRRLWGF